MTDPSRSFLPGSSLARILLSFGVLQLVLIAVGWGPFRDEAFYAAAGLDLIRGRTADLDLYLGWFNGSPFLWPVASGAGHELFGFLGSRLVALGSVLLSVVLLHGAASKWVGRDAADLGAVLMLLRGSSLLMGHYATYDVGALLLLALATRLMAAKPVSGGVAVAAGIALGLGALAKYPYAIMGLPILGMSMRFRSSGVHTALIFAATGAIVWLGGVWLQFGTLVPPTFSNFDHRTYPRLLVAGVLMVYVLVPLGLVLAALRWRNPIPRDRRALLLGVALLLLWPALHVLNGRITSAFKHVWVASMLLIPIIGLAAHRLLPELSLQARRWAMAGVILFGLGEWVALEPATYSDHRAILTALDERLEEGDRVAVMGDNDRWIFTAWLYGKEWIETPIPVEVSDPETLCEVDWIVHSLRAPLDVELAGCRVERVTRNDERRGFELQPRRISELWRVVPVGTGHP